MSTARQTDRPCNQRCDLVLNEHGALTVVISGDWLANEHIDLLRAVRDDLAQWGGPKRVDLARAGALTPEARATLACMT